jgi:hypothetical protein
VGRARDGPEAGGHARIWLLRGGRRQGRQDGDFLRGSTELVTRQA